MLLSSLFLLWCPQSTRAEDGVVCAAIYPCNEDGSVQSPYNEGACAEYYRDMCSGSEVQKEGDGLLQCEIARAQLTRTNKRLKKQLRAVKRNMK